MLNNGGIKLAQSPTEYNDVIMAKSLIGKNSQISPRSVGLGVGRDVNNLVTAHTSIFNA